MSSSCDHKNPSPFGLLREGDVMVIRGSTFQLGQRYWKDPDKRIVFLVGKDRFDLISEESIRTAILREEIERAIEILEKTRGLL